MQEKFKKIDNLTKKFNVLKSIFRNPEISILLLLDQVENRYI
jgi:hypothetical protein